VGSAGYSSLLQRALTLAKREFPALTGVEVMADGSLGDLEDTAPSSSVLVAHLLQLLITFIGEALTLTLLLNIWSELDGLEESLGDAGYEQ
jgi:hypothetical protein